MVLSSDGGSWSALGVPLQNASSTGRLGAGASAASAGDVPAASDEAGSRPSVDTTPTSNASGPGTVRNRRVTADLHLRGKGGDRPAKWFRPQATSLNTPA